MNRLIAQYLDGELGEEEAARFIDALERDPGLAAELGTLERIQLAGRSLAGEGAPSGFADRTMDKLSAAGAAAAPRRARFFVRRSVWAAAAGIALAFSLGRATNPGRDDLSMPVQSASTANTSISAASVAFAPGRGDLQRLRVVRLSYAPSDGSAKSVSVAGSFNGWNADEVPMRNEDGTWNAVLVLPQGSYEYMFVEDGERWVTDPLARRTRDDGFGGQNAVLDLGV